MRQGMKKMTQNDRIVIEVEEPVRGKTLTITRRVAIPPRHFVKFELECDMLEGKFEINQSHSCNKENQIFGWIVL